MRVHDHDDHGAIDGHLARCADADARRYHLASGVCIRQAGYVAVWPSGRWSGLSEFRAASRGAPTTRGEMHRVCSPRTTCLRKRNEQTRVAECRAFNRRKEKSERTLAHLARGRSRILTGPSPNYLRSGDYKQHRCLGRTWSTVALKTLERPHP